MAAENRALGDRIAACKREIRARSIHGVERRMVAGPVEARATAAGWQIVGHGIVYNSISEDLGGWREIIMPGAATDVLAGNPDIRGLLNHNPDLILGRTRAGTMTVEDDPPTGVGYVIDPPNVSYANDLRVSLERGDVDQSSFAFRVARGGATWEDDPEFDDMLLRRVHKMSAVVDMSPVTYAAYESTDSGVSRTQGAGGDENICTGARDCGATNHLDGCFSGHKITAPAGERHDDEPAGQRVADGPDEDQQAGTSARDERAERLRLRIGEPPL